MKKKSSSQSAFFNVRILFGLFVMLAGVFLALASFGTFSRVFAQNGTTREQMTLALAQALNVPQPPACVPGAEMFNDVPASNPFCPFIEELSRRGITGGCGGGNFCPGDPVTRQQMAVFLVRTVDNTPGIAVAGMSSFTTGTVVTNWFNRFGGEPTINHIGIGQYQVTFPGLEGRLGCDAIVVITVLGFNGFASNSACANLDAVDVNTFNEFGTPTDRSYSIVVMTPGAAALGAASPMESQSLEGQAR
jgi:S-layer homology domain